MKTALRTSALLLASMTILLTGCSKNETVAPAPVNDAGQSLSDLLGTLTFTVDGTPFHAQATFAHWQTILPGFHNLNVVGSTTSASAGFGASITGYGPQTLQLPFAGTCGFTFTYGLGANMGSYEADMSSSTGTLQFTRMDTVPGGRIEGSFSIDNVRLFNASHQPVSDGHSITNGSFSVSVP